MCTSPKLQLQRVLESRAFGVALAYALSLPAHKYGVDDRPEPPLEWDRKAWSHLHFFKELGVELDPGNVVLACCLQAIMCRGGTGTGWERTRLCDHCTEHREDLLAHFKRGLPCADLVRIALVYAQENEGKLQVDHLWSCSKMEGMGDVIEAIGGICHPWRRESKAIQAYLAQQSGVPATEFRKVGDVLGQLARSCKWFPREAYRHGSSSEDRAKKAIDTVVERILPADNIGGCYMCANRRDPASATTGDEAALETDPQRGWTSRYRGWGEWSHGGDDRWAAASYNQGSGAGAWSAAAAGQEWGEGAWGPATVQSRPLGVGTVAWDAVDTRATEITRCGSDRGPTSAATGHNHPPPWRAGGDVAETWPRVPRPWRTGCDGDDVGRADAASNQ